MLNKRIYEYSQAIMEDAIKCLADSQKSYKAFNATALSAMVEDDTNQKPYLIEVASRIEDFANIIYNGGFDINSQKYLTMHELSDMMEELVRTEVTLSDGSRKMLGKDNSLSTLGFVVSQTITRLITKMEYHDLEAWMLVSREMNIPDGAVWYNVTVGTRGEAATTRISEGGEFNTLHLESTEEAIKTSGGKVGVMVSFSEEAARRCGLQAINMLTEAAIVDMKRFKSIEAIRMLEANAHTYFDGLDPLKMPSGVSLQSPSTKNGAILFRDLEAFMCDAQNLGFNIDVIFIHPLAYKIFYREPAIREYLDRVANIQYLVPKKKQTVYHNFLTKMTKKVSGTQKAAEGETFNIPQLLSGKLLNVVVTPIVAYHPIEADIMKPETRYTANPVVQYKYNPSSKRLYPCSDILLIDSSRALTYSSDGRGVISDRIENRLQDTTIIKFKEYYNFLLDKDHGVFAMRNISLADDTFNPYKNPAVVINHSDLFPPKP